MFVGANYLPVLAENKSIFSQEYLKNNKQSAQPSLFILGISVLILPTYQLSVDAQTSIWGDSTNSLPVMTQTQSQNNINFKVCYESKTWIRPTPAEQKTHLVSFNGRYTPEEIAELGGDYWKYNIFAFTSFPGGSGNFDIGHRSGLWTSQDSNNTKKCNDYVTQLNSGKTGAVWILNYKIVSFKWVNNRYILQGKQTKQGWQQIQFSRRESLESLPLTVMNERGQNVPVLFY
jgi:hypothetical protein